MCLDRCNKGYICPNFELPPVVSVPIIIQQRKWDVAHISATTLGKVSSEVWRMSIL